MAREPFNRFWAETPVQFEEPPTGIWEDGWTGGAAEDPPEAKWQNWWQNRSDIALQQIERFGVMDWHDESVYGIGGRARGSDGRFYLSVITPNEGNDPTLDDGSNWVVDRGAGQNVVVFDSPGSHSWTVPAVLRIGLRKAHVTVTGAGGSGGRGIGVGGSPGGDSSFGPLCTGGGGLGGTGIADGSGSTGGAATGGDLNIQGGSSGGGSDAYHRSLPGGASYWGGGGRARTGINLDGGPGLAYGSGGAGSTRTNNTAAGGGSAGGTAIKLADLTGIESVAVNVGEGGSPGQNNRGANGVVVITW